MKCPKCGAHSTIIENDGSWDSPDDFYYCYGSLSIGATGGKIIQQGTQRGCSRTFSIPFTPKAPLAARNSPTIKVPEAATLDPWGAPVDTRGYPRA